MNGEKDNLIEKFQNLDIFRKRVEFKNRVRMYNHASDPATCSVGEIAIVNGDMKVCTAENTWTATGGGGVAGSDTQVQFNDGGVLAGDATLTWNKTTRKLNVGDEDVTSYITGPDGSGAGYTGGSLGVYGGTGGDGSNGGGVEVLAGYGGAASGGNGGSASIVGGSAQSGNANGGDATVSGGAKDGTGRAGKVILTLSGSNAPDDAKKSAITFKGEGISSFRHLFYAQKNTTNGTATTMCDIDLSAFLGGSTATSGFAVAKIIGRRTGGTSGSANDFATYTITQSFKNASSSFSLVGSLTTLQIYEDQSAWDAVFTIASSTTLQVQVTGAADNNITWRCEVAVYI
jgi:hypothetical protein